MVSRYLFYLLLFASLFVGPAVALFVGIAYALIFSAPHTVLRSKTSRYLLQFSVVGLGFGMNLHQSLRSSCEGMLFTIASVIGVLLVGYILGRIFGIDRKLTHLISSGTAICGGSAIAAVGPAIDANENQMSVSLAVVFTLNAVALFIFPTIGHTLSMSQEQFGMWAAIAIHDTSSVVGAGAAYGPEALVVATTVKLTRALWIIPLTLVSVFIFPSTDGNRRKISIPWFIFMFVGAMLINTYFSLNENFVNGITFVAHKALSVTLFLIGSALSVSSMRRVGAKPIVMGITLWILISVVALIVILSCN